MRPAWGFFIYKARTMNKELLEKLATLDETLVLYLLGIVDGMNAVFEQAKNSANASEAPQLQ